MICSNCKEDSDLWVRLKDDRILCPKCYENRKGVVRGFVIFIVVMLAILVVSIAKL